MHINIDEAVVEKALPHISSCVENVVKLLSENDMTVSFAESCTGGLLSELITSVSGASAVFEAGFCTYSERIKKKALNVPEEILSQYGVVSEETALYMSRGIKSFSGSSISASVTGIAGPTGAEDGKPVGTVCVGFCLGEKEETCTLKLYNLGEKSRDTIRRLTAVAVFMHIGEYLQGLKG